MLSEDAARARPYRRRTSHRRQRTLQHSASQRPTVSRSRATDSILEVKVRPAGAAAGAHTLPGPTSVATANGGYLP